MTYQIGDFTKQLVLIGRKNHAYPGLIAELNAIASALNTDPTTHDLTIALPPAAVKPDKKNHTPFTNEVNLLINRGKGGNLSNSAMATAISNALGQVTPPANTTAPAVTGTPTVGSQLIVTNGVWTPVPTSFSRQWLRNGAAIAGATAAGYTLVAADSGTNVSCAVTAYNAAGEATANSNAVAVT